MSDDVSVTDEQEKRYAPVLAAMRTKFIGWRATMQPYADGGMGFGIWQKEETGMSGFAVIVQPGATDVDAIARRVVSELSASLSGGDRIGPREHAKPKSRRITVGV